jgi:hypothetical protein
MPRPSTPKPLRGYDGVILTEGARVELHPGTDLWMQGARYGTIDHVTRFSGKVSIHVDRLDRLVTLPADRVRLIPDAA